MSAAPSPEWNRTESDYPRHRTIAELFSEQAARTPDAVAICAGARELNYRELDERSSQMARYLRSMGAGPETLVGIAMPRTELLVVGLLAILKAGAAYVPLDPTYPLERLSWIIEDSGMPLLLTTAEARDCLPPDLGRAAIVDADDSSISRHGPEPFLSSASSGNLAYVIYTSGSTGKPKGVMVENRNVVNFFTGMDRALGCEPGIWLAVTSISFDISVLELLWTLTRGFAVVIYRGQGTSAIVDQILQHQVTHLQMTPSLARMLALDPRAFAALGLLRQILLGGEALPATLIVRLRQVFHGEIHNMYGPTETTIWSTTGKVAEADGIISIGRPIANTQVYILDAELRPVPVGSIGELFIGGDGVARGYWGRPDLTAERFVTVPSLSERLIYRTGDLVRYLPDGRIEFLGRADYQIKLRGHRIEPGEIEAHLEQCPGIRQAVVVLREDREDDQRLVAYLVAEATADASAGTLRSVLARNLPEYMIPSSFVSLPTLPLTDNGKIDRRALLRLPPPSYSAVPVAPPANGSISEMGIVVARIWQDVLGVASVGLNGNFFDLGAHSLMVAEVQARLSETLGREISLVDLYQFSTVKTLAEHLVGVPSESRISDRAQRRRLARQRWSRR